MTVARFSLLLALAIVAAAALSLIAGKVWVPFDA